MHSSPELNLKSREIYNPTEEFDKELGAAALREMLHAANADVADSID